MITFKNYTDKNVIIQDCLTDCTDVETDIILDNYFNIRCA